MEFGYRGAFAWSEKGGLWQVHFSALASYLQLRQVEKLADNGNGTQGATPAVEFIGITSTSITKTTNN